MASIPPDYFRTAAEQYNLETINRKDWLRWQISIAEKSLLEYQKELIEYYKEVEKLGAVFDKSGNVGLQQLKGGASQIMTVGTVLAAVPTGYTQVVGGIMIFASSFFQKAENKRNAKRVNEIISIAIVRNAEAQKVGVYKTTYERELLMMTLIPIVLVAVLIFIILK
ncbi:MAG TPA: hypothetical protein VGN64_06730 [Dyadobacter sp.]|jgi:hypothetical protein|nr:hypothetical protein [Dyadobacter sp.]